MPTRLQKMSTESPLSPRFRALAIGVLTLVAAAAFSRLGVSTALPAAAEELNGLSLYGWVFTAFTLANIVSLAVSGPLFDRFGIARPLALGTASFAGGLLIASLAPTMWMLVLGRVFQGLGSGALSIAAYSAIGKGFPDEVRPKMLALNASAFTVPSLIGPLLAGLITESFTWRWVFGVLVPLAPLAALLVRGPLAKVDAKHLAGNGDKNTGSGRDLRLALCRLLGGGLALSAGLGAVLTAPNLPIWPALAALVVGLPCAYLGIQQVLPAGVLTARRGLPANVVYAAALSMAFFTADLFIPLALTSIRDISATAAGTVLTAGIIGWTVGAYTPSRLLTAGLRKSTVAKIGSLLVIVGLTIICGVVLSSAPILIAVVGWIVAGLGAGTGFTVNSVAVLDDANDAVGSASSHMELGNQAGIAIGTGIAGALVAALGATAAGLAGVFILAGAGALLALLVSTRFAQTSQT